MYNQITLMTYTLYTLIKWTAEVANCVLEGLLGEYHISFPITHPWTPIFLIKAVMVKLTLMWIQTWSTQLCSYGTSSIFIVILSQQQQKVTYVACKK